MASRCKALALRNSATTASEKTSARNLTASYATRGEAKGAAAAAALNLSEAASSGFF